MYIKESILERKVRSLLIKFTNKIENNNNTDFSTNGEELFLKNLIKGCNDKERTIVFDVGANIGSYTETVKNIATSKNVDLEVHLFEPTKSCFSVLKKLFNEENNIVLNNFGLSDQKGERTIYYDFEKSGLASLYNRKLEAYSLALNNQEEIKLDTLNDYIISKKITHINLIKLDIEGHELNALIGMDRFLSADFIDYIQFEYGGANLDSHTNLMQIYELLELKGFKIAKIMPSGLQIRNYSPYMDNFNNANYMAVSERLLK